MRGLLIMRCFSESLMMAQIRMMAPVILLSAFLSNTVSIVFPLLPFLSLRLLFPQKATVAMMIPIIISFSEFRFSITVFICICLSLCGLFFVWAASETFRLLRCCSLFRIAQCLQVRSLNISTSQGSYFSSSGSLTLIGSSNNLVAYGNAKE